MSNVEIIKENCIESIGDVIKTMEEAKEKLLSDPATKSKADFLFDVGKTLKKNTEGAKII